jgi:gamma-glutamylcyclotransferase (GGCT)/AIG2-like uncharacterized protein YtfP
MTTYFAYGSNMSVSQMARRCPSAACRGNASLADHDFLINDRGFATIVPKAQSTVYGILWTLSESHIVSLDEYEGIEVGHYRKEQIAVCFNGQTVVAMVYVATDSNPGIPEASYIECIVDAATAHGLTLDYIGRLAKWLPPPLS